MGVYITIADIVPGRLETADAVRLTRDAAETTVDEDRVEAAIVEAEAVVDGYVGVYYDLVDVHSTPPQLLKSLAATVAVYRLHRRRNGSLPGELETEYKEALKMLEGISRGRPSLGVQPHKAADSQRRIRTGGTTRRLRRSSMEVM